MAQDVLSVFGRLLDRPGARDTTGIVDLVRGGLADDPALQSYEEELRRGAPAPRTEQRVQLALEDRLEGDPAFASAVKAALDRTDVTSAAGPSTSHQHANASVSHVGGNVRVDNGNKNFDTRIAVGGGAVLAVAILLVWWWYSTDKAKADDTAAYRAQAQVTCERIKATEGNLPVDRELRIHRDDLLTLLSARVSQTDGQLQALLRRKAPGDLADDRGGVQRAAAKVVVDIQSFVAAGGRPLPATFDAFTLSQLSLKPEIQRLNNDYAALGDALARLSGRPCSLGSVQGAG